MRTFIAIFLTMGLTFLSAVERASAIDLYAGAMADGHISAQMDGIILAGSNAQPGQQVALSALDRETVRDIQRYLNSQGFNAGPPDGVPGERTKTAIATYSNNRNLPYQYGYVFSLVITHADQFAIHGNNNQGNQNAGSGGCIQYVATASVISISLTGAPNYSFAPGSIICMNMASPNPADPSLFPVVYVISNGQRQDKTPNTVFVRSSEIAQKMVVVQGQGNQNAGNQGNQGNQGNNNQGGPNPGDNSCGWYAIAVCSSSQSAAQGKISQFGGFVIDTNDTYYPNFRNGFYCVVDGPYDRNGAADARNRFRNNGSGDAYIKQAC